MPQLLRFAVTAIVDHPAGVLEITTPADDVECLFASTPLGAARAWYWRLSEPERRACLHVVVSAWAQPTLTPSSLYAGPDIVFSTRNDWRRLPGRAARSQVRQPLPG
jgi:hypothetical protein